VVRKLIPPREELQIVAFPREEEVSRKPLLIQFEGRSHYQPLYDFSAKSSGSSSPTARRLVALDLHISMVRFLFKLLVRRSFLGDLDISKTLCANGSLLCAH
jgi:hypothetical protein